MKLSGKTALITGAARGIGREIALLFAREGADIAAVDMEEGPLSETAAEIAGLGRKVITFKANVTKFEEAQNVIKETVEKFGKLDLLVNNAGITRDGLVLRMKEEDWDLVLAVNLKGTFNYSKAAARYMLKSGGGSIINVASVIGVMGNAGQANYAASKAGVIGLTKSLAKEFASRGVRVNAIAPGYIQTAMTDSLPAEVKETIKSLIPMSRLGTPEDVAKAALFLASDDSSYTTGGVLLVSGGMAM
jgi:3-oxoacyl-[acyl-carrier protein] reductase